MSTALVIRDSGGNPINIGEWDILGGENPLPEGATQAEEEIITLPDGGRWPAADPIPAWAAALD